MLFPIVLIQLFLADSWFLTKRNLQKLSGVFNEKEGIYFILHPPKTPVKPGF